MENRHQFLLSEQFVTLQYMILVYIPQEKEIEKDDDKDNDPEQSLIEDNKENDV